MVAAAATPLRARSPDVLKNKVAAEERRKSLKAQQGLSPRTEAALQAKAAKAYVAHLRSIESAAAKQFATRGPPTAVGTNAEDAAWLESNKGAPGVFTLPCGLQYKVLKSARTGAKSPKAETPVEVNYRGKLLSSGVEFHCSWSKASEPERHTPNRSIQGWMVALQLMGVGDKWLLYLPSELAYGDVGSTNGWKNIPPHAAISFELELAAVRSDAVPLKVARPPGLTTEALMELAASAAQKPAAAPEGSNDENETPAPTGNASGGGAPVARDGLFERSAVMVRRGGLSDRLRAPPIVSVSASGAAGASATATEVAALRSRLSAAEQTASKHAALVETLSEENRQLRASLDRAIQRAQEWQAEAHALAGEPPVQQHAAAADDDDVEDNDEPPLEVTAGEAPSRAIVLVGVTGGGKSSVGCVLARDDAAFGISAGLSSATAAAAHVDYASIVRLVDGTGNTEERRHVTRIIDTVGLHDTSLPAATAISNFASFEDLVPLAGTDLFLFVMPYGRFSAASEAALDAFLACCGDGALEHTVIVFTRCVLPPDELKAELCRSAPPSLRRILSRLAFPSVIGVDLVRRPRAALKLLRAAVDEGVEALNTERYEPAVLAAALEEYGSGQQEDERAAFATAVSDWRKGGGAAVDVS